MTSSTPRVGATHPVLPFDLTAARRIVSGASRYHIDLVVAPPGQGKSVHTRQVIADAIKAHTLRHVLWATHSINEEDSLGRGALAAFTGLKLPAEIVYSRTNFSGPGLFEDQFRWPSTPLVKVISHARIPLIFGGTDPTSAKLRGADLLVIDEDPTASLLLASPVDKNVPGDLLPYRLVTLAATGDPACLALLRVADLAVAAEAGQRFARLNKFAIGHGVYGEEFWPLFLREHPGPVGVGSLRAALSTSSKKSPKIEQPKLVAEEFAEDARCAALSGPPGRTRFGVHWAGNDFSFRGLPSPPCHEQALLRFNLRPPINLSLPVIVLDGYANNTLYDALFAGRHVRLHEFARAAPLDIECSDVMHLDPMLDGNSRGNSVANRLQIAEELAAQRTRQLAMAGVVPASPVGQQLLIAGKASREPDSDWQRMLQEAYGWAGLHFNSGPGIKDDVQQMHWHAGRGRNDYEGADVYALNPPSLSLMSRDYTTSALFPDRPDLRERLFRHAHGAELLQMLNRGRQPNFSGPGHRPRIIVGSTHENISDMLGDLRDRATLRPYQSILLMNKGSKNPRWRDMTVALAHELLVLFPHGLSKRLLLGLPRNRYPDLAVQAKLEAQALMEPAMSHLHQAFHNPSSWKYHDVLQAGGSNNDAPLDEAMEGTGLTREYAKRRGSPKVYVAAGSTAEQADDAITLWLK